MRIVDKGTKSWHVVEPQADLDGGELLIAKFIRLADAQEYLRLMQHKVDLANTGKDVIHG
jgi:hypothetical protein